MSELVSELCSRVSVYVQSARVQRSLCLCCFPFSRTGTLCVTMSRRNTSRTPDYLTLHRALGWMVGEVGGQQIRGRGLCVCVTMSRRNSNTARTPSLSARGALPSARPLLPFSSRAAAQSDPELRELSPMRSGLAVRGGKSHWPVNERNLPCCFVAVPLFLAP